MNKFLHNPDVELLVQLAKEVESGDPFDWSDTNIDEDYAYRIMATHVLEMTDDKLLISATLTKLLVENMILNARLIMAQENN